MSSETLIDFGSEIRDSRSETSSYVMDTTDDLADIYSRRCESCNKSSFVEQTKGHSSSIVSKAVEPNAASIETVLTFDETDSKMGTYATGTGIESMNCLQERVSGTDSSSATTDYVGLKALKQPMVKTVNNGHSSSRSKVGDPELNVKFWPRIRYLNTNKKQELSRFPSTSKVGHSSSDCHIDYHECPTLMTVDDVSDRDPGATCLATYEGYDTADGQVSSGCLPHLNFNDDSTHCLMQQYFCSVSKIENEVACKLNTIEHFDEQKQISMGCLSNAESIQVDRRTQQHLCLTLLSEKGVAGSGSTRVMQHVVSQSSETKQFLNNNTFESRDKNLSGCQLLAKLTSEVSDLYHSGATSRSRPSRQNVTKNRVSFSLPLETAVVRDCAADCQTENNAPPSLSTQTYVIRGSMSKLKARKRNTTMLYVRSRHPLEAASSQRCEFREGDKLVHSTSPSMKGSTNEIMVWKLKSLKTNLGRNNITAYSPFGVPETCSACDKVGNRAFPRLKSAKCYLSVRNRTPTKCIEKKLLSLHCLSAATMSREQTDGRKSMLKHCDENEAYAGRIESPIHHREDCTKSVGLLNSGTTSDGGKTVLKSLRGTNRLFEVREDQDRFKVLNCCRRTEASTTLLPDMLSRLRESAASSSSSLLENIFGRRLEETETKPQDRRQSSLLNQPPVNSAQQLAVPLPEVSYINHLFTSGTAPYLLKRIKQRFNLSIFDQAPISIANIYHKKGCGDAFRVPGYSLFSRTECPVENLSANNNVFDDVRSQQQQSVQAAKADHTGIKNITPGVSDTRGSSQQDLNFGNRLAEKNTISGDASGLYENDLNNASSNGQDVSTDSERPASDIGASCATFGATSAEEASQYEWSGVPEISLQPKPGMHSVGLVLYYPAERKDDYTDLISTGRLVISEEPIEKVTATSAFNSTENVVAKQVMSSPEGSATRTATAVVQRKPSVLKRVKAFFARSHSSSCNTSASYFTVTLSNDGEAIAANIAQKPEAETKPLTSSKSVEVRAGRLRVVDSDVDDREAAACRTSTSLAWMRTDPREPAVGGSKEHETIDGVITSLVLAEETQSAPIICPYVTGSELNVKLRPAQMAVTSGGDPKSFTSWDHGRHNGAFVEVSNKDSSDKPVFEYAQKYAVDDSQPPKCSCRACSRIKTSLKCTAEGVESTNISGRITQSLSCEDANLLCEQQPSELAKNNARYYY